MTVLGLGVLFHRTFEVRTGQIVEQHFEFRMKQIGPLLAQPQKEFLLVFEHQVEAAIQAILFGHSEIGSEQCIHGGSQVPLAMPAKLATRIQ